MIEEPPRRKPLLTPALEHPQCDVDKFIARDCLECGSAPTSKDQAQKSRSM